jgi:CelD/BcsL family acetyltransferase involved in cellulose biosynthesis
VGGAAANYTEPLYVSGDTQLLPLLEGALAARGDWDALYLSDVRDQSRLLSEHRNCPPCKKLKRVLAQDHMDWAIDLSEGEEKYLKGLSGKLKRDLRAKRQRLEKEYGPLALKEIKGAEAVARHFDLYTQFSLRAFTTRGRRSAFEDERYAAFYKDFLIRMDAKGRLDAHALSAGDRLLALSFGYRFGKGFNWVLTGFNYDYKYFRPGYLLIEELIKEIVRRGETYYNWYSHERFYKAQWCNRRSPLYRFSLFRRTLKGACYGMLRNAERALRSNRAVVSLVRRVRRS